MERMQGAKGDVLGILAAAWIGSLGGVFVAALGQATTLIEEGFNGYGVPTGYYASGIVYGFVGGAFVGSLVGLVAGAALVGRLGNRRTALVGGLFGLAGAGLFGLFADGLAMALEGAFMNDPAAGGLLAAVAFAAVGGVFAVVLRSGSAGTGRRASLQDLIAGGILGAFLGMLGGAFAELATAAWVEPSGVVTFDMNAGAFFGFYLGAVVGAGVAALLGTTLRRRRAVPEGSPSAAPGPGA